MMKNPWGKVTGIRPVKIARTMLKDGKSEMDFVNHFKTELDVSDEKTMLTLDIALREISVLKDIDSNDVCIYVGVPFCKTRCLYCSFVTVFHAQIFHSFVSAGVYITWKVIETGSEPERLSL